MKRKVQSDDLNDSRPKKKFKLFDMNRNGKGVKKDEDNSPTFKNFFKIFWRKSSKLLSVNLLMIFQIIPLVIAFFVYLTGPTTATQTNAVFSPVFGAYVASGGSPSTSLLFGLVNFPFLVPVYNTPVIYIAIAIGLATVITFGWQNVGATYVIRGLVAGDPVFVLSDYFYAIKRNFKQGFLVGLLDCLIIGVLVVDFMFFYYNGGTFLLDFMYFVIFAIAIIYFLMRFYIYLMVVTFDMKIRKILKNALIFSIVGIGRNMLAVLGIAVLVLIDVVILLIFAPLGIVLPIFYLLGFGTFISAYAAYPLILKYMVKKPPQKADTDDGASGADDIGGGDGDVEIADGTI